MTLSSGSRQHRKSMLPIPRLVSSRMSSRRLTSGDTSRIARRVPSPMLAAPASLINGPSSTHPRVPHPSGSRILPPPEFGTRRGCSPSRIPSPSTQTSYLTPEQSETSSNASTPRAEGGSAEAPYPSPPASVETKNERINGQEGRAKVESFAQHGARGPPVPPAARYLSRRRESTALTTSSFSRAENSTPADATSYPVANKKLAMSSSVSGKENRRPPARARVLLPAAPAVVVVPPRPIQRTPVTLIPSSETSPRPLVIEKKPPRPLMAIPGQGLQVKSTAESAVAPVGIKALIGDLDRFAKEWTGMFDELYGSAGCHGGELTGTSTRIHHIVEPETPGTQVDDPEEQSSNSENGRMAGGTRLSSDCEAQVGELTTLLTPSASSASSIGSIQASSTDGETVYFDVSAASLVRWQHRDNTMLKDAPTTADMVPEIISASKPDSSTDTTAHRHSPTAVLRSAAQPITPRTPRFIPPLPEINQSPIISGPHLVDLTSAVLSSRKDGIITKFLEPPPTPTRATTETPRRRVSSRPYPPSMDPLSSSPAPITMSLVSVSIPHTSSPLAYQRLHGSPPQRNVHAQAAGDVAPMRSTSLRGLRAIFKRTSAGLTNGQRQRAESLKDLIGEPRVLSLGSISISNLRNAGIPGGGAVPAAGPVDKAKNSGELAQKATVNW